MIVAPDHPLIQFTDCFAVDVTGQRARFSRPALDSVGFEHVSPGARVRFMTDAASLAVTLRHTALMTRRDAFRNIGAVMIDGQVARDFRFLGKWTTAADVEVRMDHAIPRPRLHELVMPYGISLDVLRLEIPDTARLMDAAPRPAKRLVAYGDSVTQGFQARDVTRSWPFLLAEAKQWQLINLGYGSRQMTPGDATVIAAAKPDVLTIQIGTNDYAQQVPLGPFVTGFHAFLTQACALCPEAAIYVLSPLWTALDRVVSIKVYWAAINDATRAVGCDRVRLIDGRGLVDHDLACFWDGVHPNDAGMRQIAERLIPQLA
ncbi:MAG: SGNH/GDSL hydrolase family protein [Rhodospirillaceae bacterium]|nr:SGNH/GDSL hydrolase family protein [Rhodospirillaceae bacterium]